MEVKLSAQAAKYLERLNNPLKARIIKALEKLEDEPPKGDIKSLAGRDGYRLRVGDTRIMFIIFEEKIVVNTIAPRGQAYKGGF